MPLWLQRLMSIFKWSMVLFGILITYLAITQKKTEEVFLLSGKNCDFSFSIPKGVWVADPNAGSYANIPVMVPKAEVNNPRLFLAMNRIWPDQQFPGGWSHNTEGKCQLESRKTIRTAEGKEAQLFFSSSCDVSATMRNGRIESPFRQHTLYGYVPYKDQLADFIYLSSSDKPLLLKQEDMMVAALKSHSTSSPNCVARRTAVKKLEITP
jgi:hypothetical protein